MRELLQRRVLFVGGKGGTGKSTTAAALALTAADAGRRCLLVSMDPAHSLSDLFDTHIGDSPTRLCGSLHGLEVDPATTARDHIAAVAAGMRRLAAPEMYGEIERHLRLAESAPGAMEAALLERLAELLTTDPERYELLIFDTAPTGHTLHLLSLPEVMSTWTTALLANRERAARLDGVLDDLGGPRGETRARDRLQTIRELLRKRQHKFRDARRVLTDAADTAFILVLNPERLAILESRSALDSLRQAEIPVAALVINRVLPGTADGDFLARRRCQEQEYLDQIRRLFRDYPRYCLQLRSGDVRGLEALREFGRELVNGRPVDEACHGA